MKALITGASDGIGKEMAYILAKDGHEVIVVARNHRKLYERFKHLPNCRVIAMDLSITENCFKLYDMLRKEQIDILINNAGVGVLGEFSGTSLGEELSMIDLNVKALHVLTKLFLKDMQERNKGYILNVASIGAFFPSPLIASYYATKSYVLSLTLAIDKELRVSNKSNGVYIGAFCPSTIRTSFHRKAGADRRFGGGSSRKVAKYGIRGMFNKRVVITYGVGRIVPLLTKLMPRRLLLEVLYRIQARKIKR
ncbi:MAG: SDR family NAD(P)-dependent oxidoreductase [bacterium]